MTSPFKHLARLSIALIPLLFLLAARGVAVAQQSAPKQPSSTKTAAPEGQQAPALVEWKDDFDGYAIDAAKWERFAIEGSRDGQSQVKDGQLRQSGSAEGSRVGVRSKEQFSGDRFVFEATVVKVAAVPPQLFGNAILTVLFDEAGRNRVEWILTHDGRFEAWDITNGKFERFDDRRSGTKVTKPKIGIARRGDEFFFTLNDQVQLQRTISNLPPNFRIMLYGFGSSENVWDSVRLLRPKQPSTAATSSQLQTAPPQSEAAQQKPSVTSGESSPASAAAVDTWSDDFDGDKLDETKWEQYTFEGGSSAKVEVKNGQLRQRGSGVSRAGVRSKKSFRGERFYVEATLVKSGPRLSNPGDRNTPRGFAILAVLFDGNPSNRVEWLLTSDNTFEAWDMTNGKFQRVDNGNLGTKEKNPRLGIGRRGDQILFMLNGEIGLQRTIPTLPPNFKVMLYGFGSSENIWDAVLVQTPKQ